MSLDDTQQKTRWYNAFGLANVAAGGSSILLPLYAIYLGADAGEVGLLAAAASLISIPASFLWGYLSDRWEARKYFISSGFLGISVAFLLMAFIRSFGWLVLINGFFSLWWIASASLATILIVENEDKEDWEKRIAFFNFVVGFGWLVGLVIGFGWSGISNLYLPQSLSFTYLFIIFAFISILAFVSSLFWIPEKIKFKKRKLKNPLLLRGVLTTERFRYLPSRIYFVLSPSKLISTFRKTPKKLNYFLASVVLSFTGFSIFFVPLPVWLKESLGLSNNTIFLVFIINSFASAIFNNRAGTLIMNIGAYQSVFLSLLARIALFPLALLPLFFRDNILAVAGISLVLFLVGISWSIINIGNSIMLANMATGSLKGQIFGIYNGAIGISGILGALLGGYLAKFSGYLGAFIIASFFIANGVILFSKANKQKSNSQKGKA